MRSVNRACYELPLPEEHFTGGAISLLTGIASLAVVHLVRNQPLLSGIRFEE
jgi:hypothetical protein